MKVHNPSPDRPFFACVGSDNWYEIPPGESIDVEDYVTASTLVEHGATADRTELEAARILWAERNRGINSLTASASASEGVIVKRQQATIDVATGTTSADGPLAGDALKAAVVQANADGAEIPARASADEKRAALAEWQRKQGASSETTDFATDANGELFLDDDGQPYPIGSVKVDDDGNVEVDDDGRPVLAMPTVTDDEVVDPAKVDA